MLDSWRLGNDPVAFLGCNWQLVSLQVRIFALGRINKIKTFGLYYFVKYLKTIIWYKFPLFAIVK